MNVLGRYAKSTRVVDNGSKIFENHSRGPLQFAFTLVHSDIIISLTRLMILEGCCTRVLLCYMEDIQIWQK